MTDVETTTRDAARWRRPGAKLAAYATTVALPAVVVVALLAHLAAGGPPAVAGGRSLDAGGVSTPAVFLTALAVIVLAARLMGSVAVRLHQPRVVGEILAGIALGPSLLGLWPGATEALFPSRISGYLDSLAQVGLVLFMFMVGVELDVRRAGDRATTLVLGHASIAVPAAMGAVLGVVLYPRFAPPGIGPLPFVLFFGLALGVTAFPVLAHILAERGLAGSPTGTLALAGAAIADVTAWCLLAVVISMMAQDPGEALWRMSASVLFCLVMLMLVRPLLRALLRWRLPDAAVLIVLASGAMLSALVTDLIGVHTIFGAFLFGAMVPHDSLQARRVVGNLESFCTAFLLPVFFTQFGLGFRLPDLGTDGVLWGLCALIILVAAVGKIVGSTIALRMCGRGWRDSVAVGVLMNCRGLTELVVLKIGLSLHILTGTLFTMLVIMALVTTVVTGPLATLVRPDEDPPGRSS